MFWKTARRMYGTPSSQDPEIKRYIGVADEIQQGAYGGFGGYLQDLGHRWIARHTERGLALEIGAGAGRHWEFRRERESFIPSEYLAEHFTSQMWKACNGRGVRCDATTLPFRDAAFDHVISVYNLEHIEKLQDALREVHRVLKPEGKFAVGLPCEGGLAWNLGREVIRVGMRKRYPGVNFNKALAFEHVWDYVGVVSEIRKSGLFRIQKRRMFPFFVPLKDINLIACLLCAPLHKASQTPSSVRGNDANGTVPRDAGHPGIPVRDGEGTQLRAERSTA
jgi:SAM-dependent methyltransferase